MATSVVFPRVQFFANNGRPLVGGRIHTYVAGSSTRARTYKDAAKAQPNANPIILDARGEASVYLAEGVEYKFVIEDSTGALIMTQEPVYGAIWPNAAEWPSDATLSYQYMTEAKAAAGAIGPVKFYDTKAQADAAIGTMVNGDIIEISQDETRAGARTRYKVQAGALVFVVNLDQVRLDLAGAAGSNTVGYLPSGVGAVGRPVQAKLRESISPEDFGAVGNGIADDTAALSAAAAEALSKGRPLEGKGTYRITAQVSLRYVEVEMLHATINVDFAGIGVLMGGNANVTYNPNQAVGRILRTGGATATPTAQIRGAKGQDITIDHIDYLQLYADTTAAVRDTDYSIAYNRFNLLYCTKLELTNNPANAGGPFTSNAGGSIQWINENRFFLNRTQELILSGTYDHNHNYFFDGNFENTAVINFERGSNNKVLRARFEVQGNTTTINFGATTFNNTVVSSYDENEYAARDTGTTPGSSTVTDLGLFGNVVRDDYREDFITETVAYTDISAVVVNNQTGFPASSRSPDLQRVYSVSGGVVLCESEMLPAIAGDYYRYVADRQETTDTIRYRPYLKFYDKALVELVPVADWVVSNTIISVNTPFLSTTTGVVEGYARITAAAVTAGVGFVKVGWRSSPSQTANALARRLFVRRSSKDRVIDSPLSAGQPDGRILTTAVPTQGYVPLGTIVRNSLGTARYINTFALDTSANGALSSGATSVGVAVGTGITVGDVIGINQDDRTTHWTTVSTVAGTTIGLTVATTAAAATGSRVVFARWRTETT